MNKLKSRKFWITVAMMFGSVAAAISGIGSNNEVIAVVGIVCAIISGSIYNICEAMIDSEDVGEDDGEGE